jgi:hypothetical protein
MWINRDVDLPQALVTAERDERLVIFAGAGVSMGSPSSLPSFDALAVAISAGTLTRKDGEGLDAFLGRVEEHGVNVQASARHLIDVPASMPCRLHNSLVQLFRRESSVRIVTTNFDRHFTTALRAKYPQIDIYTAPALPLGREWNGLVYLHGAVERPNSRLLLTDRDFGLGYLADGWATRFLMEMFRQFVVVFVGYSHSDPVMRYLARSFVGGTARYALTPSDRDDHWIQLGITPVHFPMRPPPDQFAAIDDAVESWGALARMGVFDHQARIGRLVELPPPLDPENIDYLRAALVNRVTLQFFTDQASRIEWLLWADTEGFLAPLTQSASLDAAEPRLLAGWFAERFVVQHPKESLAFFQQHLSTVNPVLADAIAFHLARTENVPPEVLRLWTIALVAADKTPSRSLSRLFQKCAEADDGETLLVLFRYLIRPRLQLDRFWVAFRNDGPLALDVEIAFRGDAYDLREAWDNTLKPRLPAHHAELLAMITDWVHDAYGLLRAAGRSSDHWDPMSQERAAIESHGQDHTSDDWGLAIDVARDVVEWLVQYQPARAQTTVESWYTARPLLLQRLAIHATARRQDLLPSGALALIEDHGWLYRLSLKHETFELLRAVFAHADDNAQRRFVEHSMVADVLSGALASSPEAVQAAAYERYNVAVWLRQVAPDSSIAAAHLERLQQENPEFGPREHPDMDNWVSSGFVGGPQSPVSADELLAMSGDDAAAYLVDYQPAVQSVLGPERSGLVTVFGQAAVASIDWSLHVAEALVTRGSWKSELWAAVLAAWRTSSLADQAWQRVLGLIEAHPEIGAASPWGMASFLEAAVDRKELSHEELERLEGLGERLLASSDSQPPGIHRNGETDWLTSAINHPAGQVAMTWIKALSKRMAMARDDWRGLDQGNQGRFEALLEGTGNNAQLARVVFASQVHFLFRADREWTEANVVPLFNWNANPVTASGTWNGFLVWGRWNDALFQSMQPFVEQTFRRMNDLSDRKTHFQRALASMAAYSQVDPWHNNNWLFQFINSVNAEDRATWAREFSRFTESLSVDGATALWNRWVSDYWDSRIRGVPQPLADLERQAMVTWVCGFKAQLQMAVNLVLAASPTTLSHSDFHRLTRCALARTHAAQLGRLLRGIMSSLTEVRYDTGEFFELATTALDHGADPGDILAVAGDMVRLGIRDGVHLRDMATGGRQV